jgi:hypothetical protein
MENIYTLRLAKICLLVFTFLQTFHPAKAQFWEPFPGNAVQLYSFDNPYHPGVDAYFAAHSDSILPEGPDSAYYLYRIDRYALPADPQIDCQNQPVSGSPLYVLINQDHCLGRKMLKGSGGIFTFVSSNADTFLLQTLAATGASWTWQGNITATIDSTVAGQVLGAVDSLKYISLSSGKTLILSKAHGLMQFHPFIPFAVAPATEFNGDFKLWGIPALGLGRHLPHFGEIFQFDAGDRLGREYRQSQSGGSSKTLLDETINSQVPNSRFTYDVSSDRMDINSPPFTTPDSTYFPLTTFPRSFDSLSYLAFNLLPYQHRAVPNSVGGIPYFQNGMRDKAANSDRIHIDFRRLSGFDTCAQAHFEFESDYDQSFVTGLGEFSWSHTDYTWTEYRRLYCYEKGLETFGTCLNLSTLIAVDPAQELSFGVYPNPATDQVQVKWEQLPSNPRAITLHAANGQVVARQSLSPHQNAETIDLHQFPAGLYLIRIDGEDGLQGHRKLVIVH